MSPPAVAQARPFSLVALLFAMPIIWALHLSLVKMVHATENPLSALAALLIALSGLGFCALLVRGEFFSLRWPRIRFFAIAGFLAYVVPMVTEMRAAPEIDAGILTLIVSLTPVFTVVLAVGLGLTKASWRLILSVMAGVLGVSLLLLPDQPSGAQPPLWIIITCLVPLSYALDSLYVERYWPDGLSALQVTCGETLVSLALVLTLMALGGGEFNAILPWLTRPDFLILCVVTAIEVLLFFYLIHRAGAVLVNIASFIALPAGFFWGWLLFGEQFTFVALICSVCAIAALVLAGTGESYALKPSKGVQK